MAPVGDLDILDIYYGIHRRGCSELEFLQITYNCLQNKFVIQHSSDGLVGMILA